MRQRLLGVLLAFAPLAMVAAGLAAVVTTAERPDAPGGELLGEPPPPFEDLRWLDGTDRSLHDLRGNVVLIRWWTDTCPYCAASAPALERLHEDFEHEGLVVVGVFHPKPPASVTPARAERAAEALGMSFPIAVDEDWSVLRRWWLSTGDRRATSVSFLLDREGRIRLIHPGPQFSLEGDEDVVEDYQSIRSTVEILLAEAPPGEE